MWLEEREFPKEWKIPLIQPICKGKGNQREPGNYRGDFIATNFGENVRLLIG
jgi:hypothetical protein